MPRTAEQLRSDALRIWRAGVDAVGPERLFAEQVLLAGNQLFLGHLELPLGSFDRIFVVGAGKAGAGMVRALEATLGNPLLHAKQVAGLVVVPEDCVAPTKAIDLVAGRPAGVNEPRPEGARATQEILRRVRALTPRDLCVCLLSGGGSALLPAPIEGITLEQKVAVTRLLSAAGATINQLNTVRTAISHVKGGGLARACGAGRLVSLIISDVLGDPLDVIASGPTIPSSGTALDALQVLDDLNLVSHADAKPIIERLQSISAATNPKSEATPQLHNVVLANNATAVDGAGVMAERLGYNHAMDCARASEASAEEVGRQLAKMALSMRDQPGPNCLITGGEPTVTLIEERRRGRGGRNQQLALAALKAFGESPHGARGVALLSGGTDGEDGPTDAAGAIVDEQIVSQATQMQLSAADHLERNDAYTFFEACGGLLKTGPTGANVCDVRVVCVDQQS